MSEQQKHYSERTTTLLNIPILQKHSPNPVVNNILNHNSLSGYTGILSIGHSGSGKTTIVSLLSHLLHEKQNFAVYDYGADELMDVHNIIKKMPKAPSILKFDDASYTFAAMSEPERNKLASGLTTIRHEVKNPVIVFMNIHYSKALEKFFRDTDFKILTSISDEEMDNFQKLFGFKNTMKLHRFTRLYRSMMLRKKFIIGKYTYHTHNPFRIALISELGKLHGVLYYRDACNKCVKDFHTEEMPARDLVDKLIAGNGRDKTRSCLRWYLYYNQNRNTAIESRTRSTFNMINKYAHKCKIDWDEVEKIIHEELSRERKKRHETLVKVTHEKKTVDDAA